MYYNRSLYVETNFINGGILLFACLNFSLSGMILSSTFRKCIYKTVVNPFMGAQDTSL